MSERKEWLSTVATGDMVGINMSDGGFEIQRVRAVHMNTIETDGGVSFSRLSGRSRDNWRYLSLFKADDATTAIEMKKATSWMSFALAPMMRPAGSKSKRARAALEIVQRAQRELMALGVQ